MEELIKSLKAADDDYLISLSNKGTLKRAYKDLETAAVTASYIENSAYVDVDKEKCLIAVPLPESQCTCPSRSICRHIITAILWLRKEHNEEDEENEPSVKEQSEPQKNTLADELAAYPADALQKAMKKRYYAAFVEKARVGILPRMEELSVITVEIPEDNVTVKLMSPLEYSACSCHSNELCKHKAAAILTWKLKHKIISIDDLKIPEEKNSRSDHNEVKSISGYAFSFLSGLLSDGLVRASENISDESESVAVMCHNARIADGERLMREIANRLSAYIEHSPEFDTEILAGLVMDGILLFQKINFAQTDDEAEKYLGEFKSTYSIVDTLELIPLAQRHFSSAAGYEGDIYYFINKAAETENRFLTYSDVRPTFYEGGRTGRKSKAPWGLYGTVDEIGKYELRLTLPKISDGKLSSSNETRAEIIGKCDLSDKSFHNSIYFDFSQMIADIFSKEAASDSETERLVLVCPKRCVSSATDEITQSHSIVIEDKFGQQLSVRARYRSDSKEFFTMLMRIGEKMLQAPGEQFVIFASIYIDKGRCCLYPLAVFNDLNAEDQSEAEEPKYKYDGAYSQLSQMFDEARAILADMLQCGINSYDLYTQAEDCAADCERAGLLSLSIKLKKLSELLAAKKHSYSTDNTELILITAQIHEYLNAGERLTGYKMAIHNLYQKGDE